MILNVVTFEPIDQQPTKATVSYHLGVYKNTNNGHTLIEVSSSAKMTGLLLIGLTLEDPSFIRSDLVMGWKAATFQQVPSHVISVTAICNINGLPFYRSSYSMKACPCAFKTKAVSSRFDLFWTFNYNLLCLLFTF